MDDRLKIIRESEKKSHIEMYSNQELYKTESWLKKPIKTVIDIIPLFQDYEKLRVLDLGCGIGRNCISIAKQYKDIDCIIECVDILDLAIEKLYINAEKYGVSSNIKATVQAIEDFQIENDWYDLIIVVSALEHIDTEESFIKKLKKIRDGICKNGIVCLVINSNVLEKDKRTGEEVPAQFEVNFPTVELQMMLDTIFEGWNIIKKSVQRQRYDIPREFGISELQTDVVTFVARNKNI